ncbi:MAG: tetratricopeptide repeat protein [Chlamydiota bacterium]
METDDEPLFIELAKVIANRQADELAVKGQLTIERGLFVEQKMATIVEALNDENTKIRKSLIKANQLLMEDLELLPNVEKELRTQELSVMTDKLNQVVDPDQLVAAGSWQNFLNLSNETLLWIYNLGYRCFEEKKYKEASSLFLILTLLNPLVCDYWVALGFAQRGLLLDASALNSFVTATTLNPDNPAARYQAADIYLQLKQPTEAIEELEALLKIIEDQRLDVLRPCTELLLDTAKKEQRV